MSAPLGGRRSDRKRLKRCHHSQAEYYANAVGAGWVFTCNDCGASGIMSVETFAQVRRGVDVARARDTFQRIMPPTLVGLRQTLR